MCLAMKSVGRPNAGNPHARFDERDEKRSGTPATALVLDSTLAEENYGRSEDKCTRRLVWRGLATCARPAGKNDQGLVVRSTLWDTIRSHVMKNADTGARK